MQSVADQTREDVALDRDLLPGRDQIEHRALQHVHAGVDLARHRLAGLLEELEHRTVRIAVHQAVGGGVLDRVQPERRLCAALLVSPQQRGQVEVGEDIAVERQEAVFEAIAELVGGKTNRTGGAPSLRLDHVGDPHPRPLLLTAQRLAQDVGQEAAGEHDLVNAVPGQPLDHVGKKGPVDQSQGGLGNGLGKRPQPRPLASD